jgi:hypothetical protein
VLLGKEKTLIQLFSNRWLPKSGSVNDTSFTLIFLNKKMDNMSSTLKHKKMIKKTDKLASASSSLCWTNRAGLISSA